MKKFILVEGVEGQFQLCERVEDPVFQRVSYNPLPCDQIPTAGRGNGLSAAMVAMLLWLAKDSASSAWHWVLAVLMNYVS